MPIYILNKRENIKEKNLMGMAASQINLLRLTARKNSINGQLEHCSLQKMALTREMKKVSMEYQEALNSKVLKWSNNSGVTYVDLSYKNLMSPGNANQNVPYLITDTSGKVVVDDKYQKYAEMISPNGVPGDYESVRTQILSQITGLSESEIDNAGTYDTNLETAQKNLNDLVEPEKPYEYASTSKFIGKAGSVNGLDLGKLYSQSGKIDLGAAGSVTSTMKSITTSLGSAMSNYLPDEEAKLFKQACDDYYNTIAPELVNVTSGTSSAVITKEGDNYFINAQTLIDGILGNYDALGGTSKISDSSGNTMYAWCDKSSSDWQKWVTDYATWEKESAEAKEEYQEALDTANQAMTSEQEGLIEFYDKLFTAIAENGWVSNPRVSDTDYLNQMLQNNQYLITTMELETNSEGEEFYSYTSSPATSMERIFQVEDSSIQDLALAEYETKKNTINEKESRIDTRQANLETELSAINEMIKGIETVKGDNEERTFSIFT